MLTEIYKLPSSPKQPPAPKWSKTQKRSAAKCVLSAHWGAEVGASHVLVANPKQDCIDSCALKS